MNTPCQYMFDRCVTKSMVHYEVSYNSAPKLYATRLFWFLLSFLIEFEVSSSFLLSLFGSLPYISYLGFALRHNGSKS